VMLNGEAPSFREGLDRGSVSFGHSVLAYCGYRAGAFRYIPGRIDRTRLYARPLSDDVGGPVTRANLDKVEIVVRHGSNREDALKAAGLVKAEIKHLEDHGVQDTGQAIYPTGWWGKYTLTGISGTTRVEFVPPALMMQATTFVSSVADFLEYLLDKRSSDKAQNFRVALHRLVRLDGEEVFQQITPYFGRIDKKEGTGRIFPVLGGIVGLACHTGSLVVVRRESNAQFAKVWDAAKFDRVGARAIEPYVDSLMACPFFAPTGGAAERVCMVLFIDSADPNFFDAETKTALAVACKGFVELLERLVESGAIRALPTYYAGYEVKPRDPALLQSLEALGVEFTEPTLTEWKNGLTFKSLRSLDLEIGRLAQAT
jgi:hypothetical protein